MINRMFVLIKMIRMLKYIIYPFLSSIIGNWTQKVNSKIPKENLQWLPRSWFAYLTYN